MRGSRSSSVARRERGLRVPSASSSGRSPPGPTAAIRLGLTAVGHVWPAALTLAVVVAAGLVAWRRRHRDVAWLCVVVVITVASALLATARLTGPLFVYVTRWWWAAAQWRTWHRVGGDPAAHPRLSTAS